MSNSESPYSARPPPATFDDFMAQVDAATQAHGGIMVDEEVYEELFAAAPPGRGARPEFIAALPRPKVVPRGESCPVCLQTLAAIETEEEYALASESFFGDTEALGLRELPCTAKHVVCARCCKQWLTLNNTCPLCRSQVDPANPIDAATSDTIEAQRQTERMLALFHSLFGQRQPPPTKKEEGRDAFAGMYS
ncbi:hypothetical protein CcaverHIS002_0203520 [Cutaneotrichosporon cavernicola]|uniref:RING-type domain-containing protein n=1 Tax=Cutaneotrichosporon cavernicola TaxID=279322 RepID=A0AA48L2I6_9TREE|nr:uncharacterized protein CcaverHIS019_0203500 [Cutaneotrichosporon cavernicola]BEI81192.1 hypothetical protein CcaverHIS002_0203520 [Cutaneotrichosporon cavernicola]BEI88988.1 hypothetical protein CcaverHIS019_0203500 [Cutaneotrichosporon cavernicola]BEI96764.1 hypothetical protein CcaverHIS631_0203530 [Cutaneotrichosporon cavernicola]BEJ04536.1 hypothetical protein CcaverHIS641_0203530 [Cutaneotrichosporon cavernicola]